MYNVLTTRQRRNLADYVETLMQILIKTLLSIVLKARVFTPQLVAVLCEVWISLASCIYETNAIQNRHVDSAWIGQRKKNMGNGKGNVPILILSTLPTQRRLIKKYVDVGMKYTLQINPRTVSFAVFKIFFNVYVCFIYENTLFEDSNLSWLMYLTIHSSRSQKMWEDEEGSK